MTVMSAGAFDTRTIDRRVLLKSLAATAGASLLCTQSKAGTTATASGERHGLVLAQRRAPLRNNGASPWYAELQLGTARTGNAPQNLKMVLDTGSNFLWSRTSPCERLEDISGQQPGGAFAWRNSASFVKTLGPQTPLSFGPWGTMMAEHGRDLLTFPGGVARPAQFYLASGHLGRHFHDLAWDGGIGFPSGSDHVQPGISFLIADLIDAGIVDLRSAQVAFNWDRTSGTGTCQIGGTDPTAYVAEEGIMMPWTGYTEYKGVQHLWTTKLARYAVGSYNVANIMFGLDSGSSHFRGDRAIMCNTLAAVNATDLPVTLTLGTRIGCSTPGEIVVPPSVYQARIEAGSGRGETVPQFAAANLTNLILAGSILMEQLYTVFEYTASLTPERVHLTPRAMYLYNKTNGPKLIQPNANAAGVS